MHNNEFAHEIKVTNKIMIFTSANELIMSDSAAENEI